MKVVRKSSAAVALFALGLIAATPAVAGPAPVAGDPVLYWNEVLLTGIGGSPTITSRGFAMVNVALHDAVNAALGSPDFAYLGPVANAGGDSRAAAAKAARDVLANLNPAKTADFDAALAASLALVADGAAKTNGIATGAAIAAATIANRTGDGSTASVVYAPSGLIGRYALTPPTNTPASLPQWATVDPWLMSAPDQFRAAPPPALDSAAYTAAFNEVKEIGSATSATRTADQSAAATFWAGAAGTGPWIRAAIDASQNKGLSLTENARLFALLATSVADATIATWDTKYHYDFWRPITAIKQGDLDGNPLTAGDAGWNSFIAAPPHPSYLSAHSAVAGSATTILGLALGDTYSFCLQSGGANRCWDSFSAAALDATNSRLWGGIHWSFDNMAGLDLGRQVGQFAFNGTAFDAVPEPAGWTTMIAGFGLIGGMIRRRRVSYRLA